MHGSVEVFVSDLEVVFSNWCSLLTVKVVVVSAFATSGTPVLNVAATDNSVPTVWVNNSSSVTVVETLTDSSTSISPSRLFTVFVLAVTGCSFNDPLGISYETLITSHRLGSFLPLQPHALPLESYDPHS